MATYSGTVLTANGQTMIARGIAENKAITFTRIGIGEGSWESEISAGTYATVMRTTTALRSPINDPATEDPSIEKYALSNLQIRSIYRVGDGQVVLRVPLTNRYISTSHILREFGIFAKFTDNSEFSSGVTEILYAIMIAVNNPEVLPVSGMVTIDTEYNVTIAVSSSSQVNIIVDTSAFATVGMVEDVTTLLLSVASEYESNIIKIRNDLEEVKKEISMKERIKDLEAQIQKLNQGIFNTNLKPQSSYGLVLKDEVTGLEFKIKMHNGALVAEGV